MQAIRIRQLLDSETLFLPQIRPLLGKRVEIIVLEDDASDSNETLKSDGAFDYPLRGSVLSYDDPFEPAAPSDEWEATRS